METKIPQKTLDIFNKKGVMKATNNSLQSPNIFNQNKNSK